MTRLADDVHALADETDFSGVVWVSDGDVPVVRLARGWADRAARIPIAVDTRFATASLTKGITASIAASLVRRGDLAFDTPVRSLIDAGLSLVDPAVTIEHLLGHTSGIADYLDEDELDDIDAYVMPVPVHTLDRPEAYLAIVGGRPQRTAPGAVFAYNNGAYVILSIAIERAAGRSYYDLAQERIFDPAGMTATAFDRSDRPMAQTAVGYLEDGRTNVLHLPVRGAGDGGITSTALDLERFWQAMFDGRILAAPDIAYLVEPRHDADAGRRYGLGFWLRADRDVVMLEGFDAGISCRTACDRASKRTYTVLANTSGGAWPMARYLDAHAW